MRSRSTSAGKIFKLEGQSNIYSTISGIKWTVLLDFCLGFNGIYKINCHPNELISMSHAHSQTKYHSGHVIETQIMHCTINYS